MTCFHYCVTRVFITIWKMEKFGISSSCKRSKSTSSQCQRSGCICRKLMESTHISDFKHTKIPENVHCSRKLPTSKQYLTKLNGDYHQNARCLADGARVSAYDRGVDGKCLTMIPEKTPQKDAFRFPSVESLSGESTTSSESDGGLSSSSLSSSLSFSSSSSADDDLMFSGDGLTVTCSKGWTHEVVSNRSDSEDKFDFSSSDNSEGEDTVAFVRHVSTPQCQNLTNHVQLAKLKKYKKREETVNSKYLGEYEVGKNVRLRSKYASVGGYLQTSGKNLKENTAENDRKFSVYRLCKSDSGGSTYQRMCKSLKSVAKRNTKCKYFKVTKVESDSSFEDLPSGCGYSNMLNYKGEMSYRHSYNSLLDYKVDTELSSSSTDEVDLNLHTKKTIGISKKHKILDSQEEDEHFGNMQAIQGEKYHDDFSNNHRRYQTLNELKDNINNNANQDDSRKNHSPRREEGKNKYSPSSGNLVEEMQRKSQNELKHRLVQLIKEQDKMLRELYFVETMKGRAVRGRSCTALDKIQWKLEMKAVENNYKMKVDDIVNHLKTSMKSERGPSTSSVINNDIQKEPQRGVNNNADSRQAEQREESPGFFRSLFRRSSKSNNQEETANAHAPTGFSLRKLFRRTRKVKDNGSSKQVSTEQDQEEVNTPKYEIINEKYMSTSLKKLKRILKNMLRDFSEDASDVDLLLEEAKLLAGVSDEMESVCNEEIAKIETKFRRKFEKCLKIKICKENENYQDEKIEKNVILDETEPGMSRRWQKL